MRGALYLNASCVWVRDNAGRGRRRWPARPTAEKLDWLLWSISRRGGPIRAFATGPSGLRLCSRYSLFPPLWAPEVLGYAGKSAIVRSRKEMADGGRAHIASLHHNPVRMVCAFRRRCARVCQRHCLYRGRLSFTVTDRIGVKAASMHGCLPFLRESC